MALLRRIQTRLFRCQGCTTACCIISPTHTHTHIAECKRTHSGRQQLRLSEGRSGEPSGRGGRRADEGRGRRDEPVRGPQWRRREDPKRSPSGAAGGESRSIRCPSSHPSSGSYIPSSSPYAEEVSGAGGRLSGAGSRSDWVIIRLTSCPPVRPNPQPPTSLVPQTGDRNCPGLEVRGRVGESCN